MCCSSVNSGLTHAIVKVKLLSIVVTNTQIRLITFASISDILETYLVKTSNERYVGNASGRGVSTFFNSFCNAFLLLSMFTILQNVWPIIIVSWYRHINFKHINDKISIEFTYKYMRYIYFISAFKLFQ